jgi:hypothetical protein
MSREFGINRGIVEAITSEEAEKVTPHICAIYQRLLVAPADWWENKKLLTIKSESESGVLIPAWAVLVSYLRVPPETARQALAWFEEKGFITVKSSIDGREVKIYLEGLFFPEDKSQ